jgi:hypothetical protein
MANDFSERNPLRRFAQAIPTRDTALTFDDPGGFQVIEYLFEKSFRNVLLRGDFLNPNDRVVLQVIPTEHQQSPQRVFSSNSQLHVLIKQSLLDKSSFGKNALF